MKISPSVNSFYLYLTLKTILTRKIIILKVGLTVLIFFQKVPILFQFFEIP